VKVTAPLERIAAAYGLSSVTLRDWKKRGITTADLLDPFTLAPKLRATAKNDSPRLRMLEDKITAGQIVFRLAVAGITLPNKK
jgi:hypothetical protein